MTDDIEKLIREFAQRSKADKKTTRDLQKEAKELKKFISEMKKLKDEITSDPWLD